MKRLYKCILLLFITLILGISTASAFEVSPANPTVGDEITISGTGEEGPVDVKVQFTKTVNVNNGEYKYNINGVDIPAKAKFEAKAEGVKELYVQTSIKKLSDKTSDGSAKVSQSNPLPLPLNNIDVKIYGTAENGKTTVDLTITASQTINLENDYKYPTNSIPPGDFKITVGGNTEKITLNPAGSTTSSGSSGSSSNTGGGGDTTPDEANGNVDFSESITKRVFSEMPVKYQFSHSSMPVRSINITSRITAMDIPANVEVLDDTSVMVKNEPTGKIYKHLNIWVGSTGFAVPENINSAIIHFRVDNDWIYNNDIDPDTIVLMHYEEEADEWTKLPTEQVSKNEEYTNYRASTPHFSPFAISGDVYQKQTDNTTETHNNSTVENSDSINSTSSGQPDNESDSKYLWIFALMFIGLLGAIILKMKKS
ncbi:PGF-pre-PGF domain-containing protein [Methanohalophilus portucalensis FDF-1]|uniref:PGF-pre-PGF domain-containing protein n=1 Tax=Methanohalophilus portucalensis FDF-1 TaxID=523843 RepID=A0A1X7P3G4_9EURY|nr:PGF-pre-PGF domain-containing protein [Methanohalophilus portucalensis FDF-1]